MLSTFGGVLPQAVGVALSPVAVILVILMLISPGGKTNATAFVIGWMIGIALVIIVALALAGEADAATNTDTQDGIDVIQLLLGMLFVFLAVHTWRSRPREGCAPSEPKLFSAIDSLSPIKAAGIGIALTTVVAPKNLALLIGAGVTVAESALSVGANAVVIVLFTIVASLSVLVPVAAVLLLGERTADALRATKEWLTSNNTAIMLVLFTVLAAVFIGKGLGIAG